MAALRSVWRLTLFRRRRILKELCRPMRHPFSPRHVSLPLALLAWALAVSPARAGLVITPISLGNGTHTRVLAVNDSGAAGGFFVDAGGNTEGFVRDAGGVVTPINLGDGTLTQVVSLNSAGMAAGLFAVVPGNDQGFLRDPGGAVTTFTVGLSTATLVGTINDS